MLSAYLDRLPLIAILRGIVPEQAVPIGQVLVDAGFAIIEVPLNSPEPLRSIRRLSDAFGKTVLIGAGTVFNREEVNEVAAAGGRLIVMPHCDPAVVWEAKSAGLVCVPGICTPTEAFRALSYGADALKLFPSEVRGLETLKAMKGVFPENTLFLPVGDITPDSMAAYAAAGAAGFGLGSALYRPGLSVDEVLVQAAAFVAAWRRIERRAQLS